MTKQVQNLLGDGEVPLIATFQTLCMSILRRDIQYLGFQSNFGIYDESDCQLLLHDVITEMDLDEKRFAVEAVSERINDLKNRGLFPEEIGPIPSSDVYNKKLIEIYASYQERLKKCNVLDHGDIVIQAVRLLTDFADVCLQYQERFKWVMVDNYEDVTTAQYRLTHLLLGEHKNLCVAGDDDQSINTKSGGVIRNILEFEKNFPDSTVPLEQSYSSTATILAAADEVVKQNFARKGKRLYTENPQGAPIRYERAKTDSEEARFVSHEICRLRTQGLSLEEIAVFYRTSTQSRLIEKALEDDAVPYHIVGGLRFFSRKEVKNILDYLRVLDNPAEEISLERIFHFHTCGIDQECGLYDDDNEKVNVFVKMTERFRSLTLNIGLSELVKTVMVESGYWDFLGDSYDYDVWGSPEQFLAAVEEFSENNPEAGLSEFLEQVSLVSDLEQKDTGQPSITLMTLHACKGMEFKAVFMIGMEERLFPHVRSLDDLDGMEEERRICYVGMTRASERLYLLNSRRRNFFGHEQCNPPSRFLKDIPQELLSAEGVLEIEEALYRLPPSPVSDGDGSFFGFPLGARVAHRTFGVGTIRKFEGSGEDARAIVWFDSLGPKKLVLRIAELEWGPLEDFFAGFGPVDDVKSVTPVPIKHDSVLDEHSASRDLLNQDLFADNVAQNVVQKGSRLNYLYFRRSIKSPSEVISELTDEQVYFRVHGKSVTENNSAVVEVRRIRQCTGNDNMLLMQCLGGRALTPSEIDEKRKEGYVSNAELHLFQMLKALSDTNWSIYHQVDVGGVLNPIDIVAVTADFQIYAIELDGPHHLLSSQRINDDRRDALLLRTYP